MKWKTGPLHNNEEKFFFSICQCFLC